MKKQRTIGCCNECAHCQPEGGDGEARVCLKVEIPEGGRPMPLGYKQYSTWGTIVADFCPLPKDLSTTDAIKESLGYPIAFTSKRIYQK